MKSIKKLIFALIILSRINLFAQDTVTIKFGPEYHVIRNKGYSFMKLIDNHSNKVYYDGKEYQIIFPNQFFVRDTAIAFNYFTGWENPAIENSTVFLFGNYTSNCPIMYVDYNHNLDFSDDGQPLKFKEDSTVAVYLYNSRLPSAYFPMEFFYRKLEPEMKEQMESMFSTMGPDVKGNHIVSIDYWLTDERMNYKITDTWLNGKNIKVGLYDWDCNGLYNDEDLDRILIGNYGEDLLNDKLDKGAIIFSKNIQIPIADEIYEVTEIEPSGKYLKMIKSNKTYYKPLGIGDPVGNLEIELTTGETIQISKLQSANKFMLLDFWSIGCKGCAQQLPYLKKLLSEYSNKIQIVGLNSGGKLSAINQYLSKHSISWLNGIANEEIMKKLRIDGFPNLLLLDSDGKIIIMNGTLEEIEKRL